MFCIFGKNCCLFSNSVLPLGTYLLVGLTAAHIKGGEDDDYDNLQYCIVGSILTSSIVSRQSKAKPSSLHCLYSSHSLSRACHCHGIPPVCNHTPCCCFICLSLVIVDDASLPSLSLVLFTLLSWPCPTPSQRLSV